MRLVLALLALACLASPARADGCYLCAGGATFVRYRGQDTWQKRHQAESCGCRIVAAASRCGGPQKRELCAVESTVQPPSRTK
jgi:hypothetical protein